MARGDSFKSSSSNPAKYFLEWKSDDQCFSFYDKDKGENVSVKLPFKFLALEQLHTVRGWHDKSSSGIFANEVSKIGAEELTVKSFKGGQIAKGLYKDIKQVVNDAGGTYHKSIYIMTEKGDILNVQFKGSSVQAWGDFTQKTASRIKDEWISVTKAVEAQKGKVKYSTPVFEFAGSLSKEQAAIADVKYDEIQDYLTGSSTANETKHVSELAKDDDDLPF